jgi:hypothetical protein
MVNLTPNTYAQWHLNELSGIVVDDATVNNRNGTTVNSPTWVAGKLNNCLNMTAVSVAYAKFGNIAAFERTTACSYEFWFNTGNNTQDGIFGKFDGTKGTYLYAHSSILYFILQNLSGVIYVTIPFIPSVWHHLIITYDGSSHASGIKMYLDNVDTLVTIGSDTLNSGTIVGSTEFMIGYGYYSQKGLKLDEFVIYDKVLSVPEVAFRWNGGSGTEYLQSNAPPYAPNTPSPVNHFGNSPIT